MGVDVHPRYEGGGGRTRDTYFGMLYYIGIYFHHGAIIGEMFAVHTAIVQTDSFIHVEKELRRVSLVFIQTSINRAKGVNINMHVWSMSLKLYLRVKKQVLWLKIYLALKAIQIA